MTHTPVRALAFVAVVLAAAACSPPVGDRRLVTLPAGDVEAGIQAFQELHCWACHRVEGHDFPDPVAVPPAEVSLGAAWDRQLTEQELMDSIINPSHRIDESYTEGVVKSGRLSRMGLYTHMEVEQLIDLVAFMRSVNEDVIAK